MHADIDWDELTLKLREHLGKITTVSIDSFTKITSYRCTSDGKEHSDSTMFNGSSGVLYSFFKFIQLLKKEKSDKVE
jgi:hypothetical protein